MTESSESADGASLAILMPVLDDWRSVRTLLDQLDTELSAARLSARVLLVDDGSASGPDWPPERPAFAAIAAVEILRLKRNLGHQRAIGVGLCHLAEHARCRYVVVMDSDGEDQPGDVPRLYQAAEALGGVKVVFAERQRRSEGAAFRFGYLLYRAAHRLLVGQKIRFGNFSIVPAGPLAGLTVTPELWSHYAAAVVASRIPYSAIPTERSKRLAGDSRMNLVSLVTHGLSALAVFADTIGTRLLIGTCVLFALTFGALLAIVGVRLLTAMAIPGWATNAAGLLLVFLFQLATLAVVFSFMVLSRRSAGTFVPARDYAAYVASVRQVW